MLLCYFIFRMASRLPTTIVVLDVHVIQDLSPVLTPGAMPMPYVKYRTMWGTATAMLDLKAMVYHAKVCKQLLNHPYHFFLRILNNTITYQFLSACFRNLTNAINSTYYQAFTMRNVWESVVSEAWRGSPFILAGHTKQPDRILNRILIGYFFWRVNART